MTSVVACCVLLRTCSFLSHPSLCMAQGGLDFVPPYHSSSLFVLQTQTPNRQNAAFVHRVHEKTPGEKTVGFGWPSLGLPSGFGTERGGGESYYLPKLQTAFSLSHPSSLPSPLPPPTYPHFHLHPHPHPAPLPSSPTKNKFLVWRRGRRGERREVLLSSPPRPEEKTTYQKQTHSVLLSFCFLLEEANPTGFGREEERGGGHWHQFTLQRLFLARSALKSQLCLFLLHVSRMERCSLRLLLCVPRSQQLVTGQVRGRTRDRRARANGKGKRLLCVTVRRKRRHVALRRHLNGARILRSPCPSGCFKRVQLPTRRPSPCAEVQMP